MASIRIYYVIVHKFGHKQEPCPIILLQIDEYTKISLYYTVLSLSLAICLWIKCSEELLLNIKKVV